MTRHSCRSSYRQGSINGASPTSYTNRSTNRRSTNQFIHQRTDQATKGQVNQPLVNQPISQPTNQPASLSKASIHYADYDHHPVPATYISRPTNAGYRYKICTQKKRATHSATGAAACYPRRRNEVACHTRWSYMVARGEGWIATRKKSIDDQPKITSVERSKKKTHLHNTSTRYNAKRPP